MDTLRSPFSIQPLSLATSSTNSSHPPPPPPQPSPAPKLDVPPKPSLTLENPSPTTFIQADASSFRHVVQRLTGLPETPGPRFVAKSAASAVAVNDSSRLPTSVKKTNSFKLYERRQKNLRKLKLGGFGELQSGGGGGVNYPGEIPSPSSLDFTELTLSPVTPLVSNPFVVAAAEEEEEEEKAIAAKGFYLHHSPLSTPRDGSSPRLLSLFPLTSPR